MKLKGKTPQTIYFQMHPIILARQCHEYEEFESYTDLITYNISLTHGSYLKVTTIVSLFFTVLNEERCCMIFCSLVFELETEVNS